MALLEQLPRHDQLAYYSKGRKRPDLFGKTRTKLTLPGPVNLPAGVRPVDASSLPGILVGTCGRQRNGNSVLYIARRTRRLGDLLDPLRSALMYGWRVVDLFPHSSHPDVAEILACYRAGAERYVPIQVDSVRSDCLVIRGCRALVAVGNDPSVDQWIWFYDRANGGTQQCVDTLRQALQTMATRGTQVFTTYKRPVGQLFYEWSQVLCEAEHNATHLDLVTPEHSAALEPVEVLRRRIDRYLEAKYPALSKRQRGSPRYWPEDVREVFHWRRKRHAAVEKQQRRHMHVRSWVERFVAVGIPSTSGLGSIEGEDARLCLANVVGRLELGPAGGLQVGLAEDHWADEDLVPFLEVASNTSPGSGTVLLELHRATGEAEACLKSTEDWVVNEFRNYFRDLWEPLDAEERRTETRDFFAGLAAQPKGES